MKDYLKYLFKRYRARFLAVGFILLLISSIFSAFDFKMKVVNIYELFSNREVQEENPELIEKHLEQVRLLDEANKNNQIYSMDFQYEKTIKEMVDKRTEQKIKANKKITEKDLKEIKEYYINTSDLISINNGDMNFLTTKLVPKKDKVFNSQMERDSIDYRKLLMDSENRLRTFSYHSAIDISFIIMIFSLFIFIISGLFTSVETMTRAKIFDESLPISKGKKFLAKNIIMTISTVIYSILLFTILIILYRFSPIWDAIDKSELLIGFFKTTVVTTGFGFIMIFVGSICGNIISYIGTGILFSLGYSGFYVIVSMMIESLTYICIKESILYKFFDLEHNYLSPAIALSEITSNSVESIIKFMLMSIIFIVIGYFIQDYNRTEYRGKFYTIRAAEKFFYVLAVLYSAFIIIVFSTDYPGSNIVLNWVLFIIFIAIFSQIYKRLFKIKVEF
ncbi:MAG: hypothetical protein Q4P31_07060 [Andreesenia angusta]|nr:hypothetical protein [Andreesenia angusta]